MLNFADSAGFTYINQLGDNSGPLKLKGLQIQWISNTQETNITFCCKMLHLFRLQRWKTTPTRTPAIVRQKLGGGVASFFHFFGAVVWLAKQMTLLHICTLSGTRVRYTPDQRTIRASSKWQTVYVSAVQRSYVLGHNSLMPMEVRAPPHYYYTTTTTA
jgi:hypothetical protein